MCRPADLKSPCNSSEAGTSSAKRFDRRNRGPRPPPLSLSTDLLGGQSLVPSESPRPLRGIGGCETLSVPVAAG